MNSSITPGDERKALARLTLTNTGHKIYGNSQGGYDCTCGSRWDWQRSEELAAKLHAALHTADVILAAGFRRVSPVTREALIERIQREMDTYDPETLGDDPAVFDSWNLLYDVKTALSVSPPADIECTPITVVPTETCSACQGTGGYWADKWQHCPKCGGSGRVPVTPGEGKENA